MSRSSSLTHKLFCFMVMAGLCSASAWAQISLVRSTTCGPQTFPATTCTISSTGSGNLLVVAWMAGGTTTSLSSVTDNAGNAYVEAGNAKSADTGSNHMADVWYAKNTRAGATAITITPNPTGTSGAAVIWEFSGVDTTAPLDQAATVNNMAASSTPSGASVNTTASAEVVVSVVEVPDQIFGIASGNSFANDSLLWGNGWAHLITSSKGTYAAQWSAASGTYASSTVSFKAAGSGGSALNACDLNSDGAVNSGDSQAMTNMILGSSPCTANIDGSGVCNAVVLQRVINAAMGGSCLMGNPHTSLLSWTGSTSSNVTGYNVYRSATAGGPYSKLNSALVSGTSYTDNSVQSNQTYYYVSTAVDNTGAESSYSNQSQAVVPYP